MDPVYADFDEPYIPKPKNIQRRVSNTVSISKSVIIIIIIITGAPCITEVHLAMRRFDALDRRAGNSEAALATDSVAPPVSSQS